MPLAQHESSSIILSERCQHCLYLSEYINVMLFVVNLLPEFVEVGQRFLANIGLRAAAMTGRKNIVNIASKGGQLHSWVRRPLPTVIEDLRSEEFWC